MIPEELSIRLERTTGKANTSGLKKFASWISPNSVMAEVGVFLGESSRMFLDSGNVKMLFCVDPWEYHKELEWILNKKYTMSEVEKLFDEHMLLYNNYVKIKQKSLDAVHMFTDNFFDIVYIDACHEYPSVRADIEAWSKKVHPGGWITGHDYSWDVKQACLDIFHQEAWSLFDDGSWIYIR
jgi:hypothetical protein